MREELKTEDLNVKRSVGRLSAEYKKKTDQNEKVCEVSVSIHLAH